MAQEVQRTTKSTAVFPMLPTPRVDLCSTKPGDPFMITDVHEITAWVSINHTIQGALRWKYLLAIELMVWVQSSRWPPRISANTCKLGQCFMSQSQRVPVHPELCKKVNCRECC